MRCASRCACIASSSMFDRRRLLAPAPSPISTFPNPLIGLGPHQLVEVRHLTTGLHQCQRPRDPVRPLLFRDSAFPDAVVQALLRRALLVPALRAHLVAVVLTDRK